jgi:hypothetical protein
LLDSNTMMRYPECHYVDSYHGPPTPVTGFFKFIAALFLARFCWNKKIKRKTPLVFDFAKVYSVNVWFCAHLTLRNIWLFWLCTGYFWDDFTAETFSKTNTDLLPALPAPRSRILDIYGYISIHNRGGGGFYLILLFQPNHTKNKEKRAKNKIKYNSE